MGTRKGMDVIWVLDTYNVFIYALIYALIYLSFCVKERKAMNSYEVMNIHFWQIWHFDVNGTGWVRLELSVVLTQTVERFDM